MAFLQHCSWNLCLCRFRGWWLITLLPARCSMLPLLCPSHSFPASVGIPELHALYPHTVQFPHCVSEIVNQSLGLLLLAGKEAQIVSNCSSVCMKLVFKIPLLTVNLSWPVTAKPSSDQTAEPTVGWAVWWCHFSQVSIPCTSSLQPVTLWICYSKCTMNGALLDS